VAPVCFAGKGRHNAYEKSQKKLHFPFSGNGGKQATWGWERSSNEREMNQSCFKNELEPFANKCGLWFTFFL